MAPRVAEKQAWRRRPNLEWYVIVPVFILSAFWLGRRSRVRLVEEPFVPSVPDVVEKVVVDMIDTWEFRRRQVRTAFVESWDAYSKYAWGQDTYQPLNRSGSQMSPEGLGWMIIDSLDTLMIMNLTARLVDARRWVDERLHYNQTVEVNVFEANSRMIGGLLSAHYLSTAIPNMSSDRDHVYLEKARDLAKRLLGAYNSSSEIPYSNVRLDTGTGIPSDADGGASLTEEVTTMQLEMKYLAYLTQSDQLWRKSETVMKVVDSNTPKGGLVPTLIDPDTGRFKTKEIRLGGGGSYYEYLIKQYLQTDKQEPVYLDMWKESLAGIQKHLITPTKSSHLSIVAELPSGIGSAASPRMDQRACHLAGTIALGATQGKRLGEGQDSYWWDETSQRAMHTAEELMKTCWAMHAVTKTGLAPEAVWFEVEDERLQPSNTEVYPHKETLISKDAVGMWRSDTKIKPGDSRNLQRPETVESLFVLWRITGDERYRQWGWEIFQAFRNHSRILNDKMSGVWGHGAPWAGLEDVNGDEEGKEMGRIDGMESAWMAGTLKYLYLLFSPEDFLPLTEVVFNTEGHVLPVIKESEFKNGWQREFQQRETRDDREGEGA